MGALSALIVSACVAPVLIGALTFIAQTGDVARGAIAMLSIALGMGTPLLLVGTSAGALAAARRRVDGDHQESLRRDVPAVAVVAPESHGDGLGQHAAVGGSGVRAGLGAVARARQVAPACATLSRVLGVVFGLYGVVLIAGGALGSTNPLAPIPSARGQDRRSSSSSASRPSRISSAKSPPRRPRASR